MPDATARLFIAVELSDGIKGELGRIEQQLKKACPSCPAKWVTPDKIHLTLNFLGDVDITKIDTLKSAISQVGTEFRAFELSLSTPGSFPNLERPRVVWVGLGGETAELSAVQKRLERLLSGLGFPPEDRSFSPHLTLARVREEASPADQKKLGEAIIKTRCEEGCSVPVESIKLIRSQLTPAGSVYTVL